MDENAKLDPALIRQCFELGLMGIETPEKNTAAPAQPSSPRFLPWKNFACHDASVGVFRGRTKHSVNNALIGWGSPDQKQKYLPGWQARRVGAYALSEAGSGSDAFAMRTRVVDNGDLLPLTVETLDYEWDRGGHICSLCMPIRKRSYRGITAFVVEKGSRAFLLARRKQLGIQRLQP